MENWGKKKKKEKYDASGVIAGERNGRDGVVIVLTCFVWKRVEEGSPPWLWENKQGVLSVWLLLLSVPWAPAPTPPGPHVLRSRQGQ